MFERWAAHLTKGAAKYPDVEPGKANWTLAADSEALVRFKRSAFRHFWQWLNGDTDEDHAAAIFFNVNGAEYVKERIAARIVQIRCAAQGHNIYDKDGNCTACKHTLVGVKRP
jgi:hypothetical protein